MQLTREEIVEELRSILLSADDKNADLVETCSEDSVLSTDLGLSSVAMLYMVIAIEETFAVRFDDVGMDDFKTLGDVVTFIEEHVR